MTCINHPDRPVYYKKNQWCSSCHKSDWNKRNPAKVFRMWARWKYGITATELDELVLRAQGRCELCNTPHPDLHIDHCHKTNSIRGMLCPSCNLALGNLEKLQALDNLKAYLAQTYKG